MSFIDKEVVDAGATLKSSHFPFPRASELRDAMVWCVTDYYTKAKSGKAFEARGLMVTGETREGKSTEIKRMVDKFNDGSTIMPDGRPAIFVECVLSGEVTWKNLGAKILDKLGYPLKGRRDQDEIWREVRKKSEASGCSRNSFR